MKGAPGDFMTSDRRLWHWPVRSANASPNRMRASRTYRQAALPVPRIVGLIQVRFKVVKQVFNRFPTSGAFLTARLDLLKPTP